MSIPLFSLTLTGLSTSSGSQVRRTAAFATDALSAAADELAFYANRVHGAALGADRLRAAAGVMVDIVRNESSADEGSADIVTAIEAIGVALNDVKDQFDRQSIWTDATAKRLYDECYRLTLRVTALATSAS